MALALAPHHASSLTHPLHLGEPSENGPTFHRRLKRTKARSISVHSPVGASKGLISSMGP